MYHHLHLSRQPEVSAPSFLPSHASLAVIHRAFPSLAPNCFLTHLRHSSSPLLNHSLLLRLDEPMHGPVIHYAFLVVSFPWFVGLGPLISIKLAVPFAARAFFTCKVTVGLHPAPITGPAIDPAAIWFPEEKGRADIITWGTGSDGCIDFDGRY